MIWGEHVNSIQREKELTILLKCSTHHCNTQYCCIAQTHSVPMATGKVFVTHQPALNSTWASKSATTGAVAARQPLTRARINPSRFVCRTTLMRPGRWLFVSATNACRFPFRSSVGTRGRGMSVWVGLGLRFC